MSEFGIYNLYLLIKKKYFNIIIHYILLNIYPVYLYINYNYFSETRISSTEIVPVNDNKFDYITRFSNKKI